MYAIRHSSDPDDPLAAVLAPPPDESAQARAARLKQEEEAKRINDEIDERIKQDRISWKKHKSMFKLLLLGQSESGPSLLSLRPFPTPSPVPISVWLALRTPLPSPMTEHLAWPSAAAQRCRPSPFSAPSYPSTLAPSPPFLHSFPLDPQSPRSVSSTPIPRCAVSWARSLPYLFPITRPQARPDPIVPLYRALLPHRRLVFFDSLSTPLLILSQESPRRSRVRPRLLPASPRLLTPFLSDFQLAFAPKAWHAERASWRAFIQLNLVRSVNQILDVLSSEMAKNPSSNTTSPVASPFIRPANGNGTSHSHSDSADASQNASGGTDNGPPLQFTHTHALLKLRLAPLRQVESDLKLLIGAATEELPDVSGLSVGPAAAGSSSGHGGDDPQNAAAPFDGGSTRRRMPGEYYVRAGASWRETVRSAFKGSDGAERVGIPAERLEGATGIIASCAADMQALWADDVVRDLLRRRKIKMELAPGL